MVRLQKATEDDFDAILRIYNESKQYFSKHNIDQWQHGYPNLESIQTDYEDGVLYVLKSKEEVIGTLVLSKERQSNYENIVKGAWLFGEDYVVVHRIAVSTTVKGQGYGRLMLKECEDLSNNIAESIRVDTHQDNKVMRQLLMSLGYRYAGIVEVEDGKRLAYEKQLGEER